MKNQRFLEGEYEEYYYQEEGEGTFDNVYNEADWFSEGEFNSELFFKDVGLE